MTCPCLVTKQPPAGSLARSAKAALTSSADEYAVQPILQQGAQARIVELQQVQERPQAGRRVGVGSADAIR